MFILYIYKSVPTSFSNLLLEFIDITWSYATESSFTLLDQNVQKKSYTSMVLVEPKKHTGLKIRRLNIFCFPPEFEMKFHIYFAPSLSSVDVVWLF